MKHYPCESCIDEGDTCNKCKALDNPDNIIRGCICEREKVECPVHSEKEK
jgi:hypothetical protein